MKATSSMACSIKLLNEHVNNVFEGLEFDIFWSKRFNSLRMIEKFDRCMPITLIREVKERSSDDHRFQKVRFFEQGSSVSIRKHKVTAYSALMDINSPIGMIPAEKSSLQISILNGHLTSILNDVREMVMAEST